MTPKENKKVIIDDIKTYDNTLCIDLNYPRNNPIKYFEVGLDDIRAADNIRISYDYDRDGYVIEQASKFKFRYDEVVDPDWKEVAFIKSWASEK